MLPPYSITHRWVRCKDFPKKKRFGKHSTIIDKCWQTVEVEDSELLKRHIQASVFVLSIIDTVLWLPFMVRLRSRVFHNLVSARNDLYVSVPHSIHVAYVRDHKILGELPSNAPRVVKAIYRGSNRLAYLCTNDGWRELSDVNLACEAWDKYQNNLN